MELVNQIVYRLNKILRLLDDEKGNIMHSLGGELQDQYKKIIIQEQNNILSIKEKIIEMINI